jgi:hypothetical protein
MQQTMDPDSPQPFLAALDAISNTSLINRYRVGVERFDRRVFQMTDAQLDMAFLPDAGVGTWPIRVLLGHLADAEMVLVHRLRRIASEDRPLMQYWDENAFIDSGLMYGTPETGPKFPPGAFVATVHTLRQWTAGWLTTLAPEVFERSGLHSELGEQKFRAILQYNVFHLDHHAWYLNRKVQRLLGAG